MSDAKKPHRRPMPTRLIPEADYVEAAPAVAREQRVTAGGVRLIDDRLVIAGARTEYHERAR
jgi:hypothetical protein